MQAKGGRTTVVWPIIWALVICFAALAAAGLIRTIHDRRGRGAG